MPAFLGPGLCLHGAQVSAKDGEGDARHLPSCRAHVLLRSQTAARPVASIRLCFCDLRTHTHTVRDVAHAVRGVPTSRSSSVCQVFGATFCVCAQTELKLRVQTGRCAMNSGGLSGVAGGGCFPTRAIWSSTCRRPGRRPQPPWSSGLAGLLHERGPGAASVGRGPDGPAGKGHPSL